MPFLIKEFEFEIQDVDRAFKYLLNKDSIGSVVIRTGEVNDYSINRETYLIARIKEKKRID